MTDEPVRIAVKWDGAVFHPNRYALESLKRRLKPGDDLILTEDHQRSSKTHRHFFAIIGETWKTLPDDLLDRFPSPDHLRKYALIRAGWRDERSIVAGSRREAAQIAAFIRPLDGYALVTVRECVVFVFTARSQATKAMDKREFQACKEAVLNFLAGMIGVDPADLSRVAEENSR